jgi:hypothetical protein
MLRPRRNFLLDKNSSKSKARVIGDYRDLNGKGWRGRILCFLNGSLLLRGNVLTNIFLLSITFHENLSAGQKL